MPNNSAPADKSRRRVGEHGVEIGDLAVVLHQLDEAHRRFRQSVARNLGLLSTDLSAFAVIHDSPGISPKNLGSDLGLSSGAVTALVDRLEQAGLASRGAHPTDRRAMILHLTAQGETILVDIQHHYRTTLQAGGRITLSLDDLDYLRRITAHLNAATDR